MPDIGAAVESPAELTNWAATTTPSAGSPGVVSLSAGAPGGGGNSLRLRLMPGVSAASVSASVAGIGELSFWWKSDATGQSASPGSMKFYAENAAPFGLPLLSLSAPAASGGWKQEKVMLFPGRTFEPGVRKIVWDLAATADCAIPTLWLDRLQFTPAPSISAQAALDSPPLSHSVADGWVPLQIPGADGGAALASTEPNSSFELDSLSLYPQGSPVSLSYRIWSVDGMESAPSFGYGRGPAVEEIPDGSTLAPGVWQTRRLYLPRPGMGVFWRRKTGFALDRMQVQPLTGTVSLAEAADFPGNWSGEAIGLAEAHASSDGTDGILLSGEAKVSLTGPGLVRWRSRGVVSVSSNGGVTRTSVSSTSWTTAEHVVGPGLREVAWNASDSGLIDQVEFLPSLPLPDVLESGDLSFTSGGTVGGVLTPGGDQGDGTDAALLDLDGTITTTLTGPGLLRFWAGNGITLELNGLVTGGPETGWQEIDVTGPVTTATWRGRIAAMGSLSMLDNVTFTTGAAARWGDRLGTAPEILWRVYSSSALEVTGAVGSRRIRSIIPGKGTPALFMLAPADGQPSDYFIRTRLTSDSGVSLSGSNPFAASGPANYLRGQGAAAGFRILPTSGLESRAWELDAPQCYPVVESGASLDEALNFNLSWSAAAQPVMALGDIPSPGEDAVLIESGGGIRAALNGPACLLVRGEGFYSVSVAGKSLQGTQVTPGTATYLLPPGQHTVTVSSAVQGFSVLLHEVALQPFTPASFPELDSALDFSAISPAFAGGARAPVSAAAAESWDGEDALKLTASGFRVSVPAPGFLTCRLYSTFNILGGSMSLDTGTSGQWQARTLLTRTAAGTDFLFTASPYSGYLDTFAFDPFVPETLAEAADTGGLTLTATPPDGWQGLRGSGISLDGTDVIGRGSATPAEGVALSTVLPSAGTLTWWWRADRGGLSATGSTTGYRSSSYDWRYAIYRAAAAGTHTWRSTLPADTANAQPAEGSAWIDSIAWNPGPISRPDAADAPGLAFTASATSQWTGEPVAFARNRNALYMGETSAWLQTVVTGPATLSFSAFIRSLTGTISVTSQAVLMRTGNECRNKWHRYTLLLGPGSHTIRWANSGSDSSSSVFFLDDFQITPNPMPDAADLANALDHSAADIAAGNVSSIAGPEASDGVDAVRMGSADASSRIAITVPGGQTLSFWWSARPDSGQYSAAGDFRMNGKAVSAIRAGTAWSEFNVDTPPGAASQVEWTTRPGFYLHLDRVSLTPHAAAPPPAVAVAGAGVTWLGNPDDPAGWLTSTSISADGASAASASAGVAELDCVGPGWLVVDAAAPGLTASLDGQPVVQQPVDTYPLIVSDWATGRTGFEQTLLQIPAGVHRCRLASDGLMFLDRARMETAAPPQTVIWHSAAALQRRKLGGSLQFINTVNSSPVNRDLETWLAGPGTLSFTWGTAGAQTMHVDGHQIQLFNSGNGAWKPWPMRLDIPEGLHRFTIRIDSFTGQGVALEEVQYEAGHRRIEEDGGVSGLDCHSIGTQWLASGGILTAPAAPPNNADFVARFSGPARISMLRGTALADAFLIEQVSPSPQSEPGERDSWLIPRRGPTRMHLEPGLKFVSGLKSDPLAEVSAATAMELPSGWTADFGTGTPWLGLQHAGAAVAPAGGHSTMTTVISGSEQPSVMTVQPPASGGNLLFRTGVWPELPTAGGTLSLNGATLTTLGKSAVLPLFTADLPDGNHKLTWNVQFAQSAAVDAMSALQSGTTRIADVIGSPELPWVARLREGDRNSLFATRGGMTFVRLSAEAGSTGPDLLAATLPGPGVFRLSLRSTGGAAKLRLNDMDYPIPATGDVAALFYQVREGGLMTISPGAGSSVEIHHAVFLPDACAPSSFSPASAIDAGPLVTSFGSWWSAMKCPSILKDSTGYAHTWTVGHFQTWAPSGPGVMFLRFRCCSGAVRINVVDAAGGVNQQLNFQARPEWQKAAFRPPVGSTVYFVATNAPDTSPSVTVVDIAVDGLSWTPDGTIPLPAQIQADADGDGVGSLVEAAFGLNQGAADIHYAAPDGGVSGLPSLYSGTEDSPFSLIFMRRKVGVAYVPEFSSSLDGGWAGADTRIEVLDQPNSLWERCRVSAPPGARFGRIRLELSDD